MVNKRLTGSPPGKDIGSGNRTGFDGRRRIGDVAVLRRKTCLVGSAIIDVYANVKVCYGAPETHICQDGAAIARPARPLSVAPAPLAWPFEEFPS